MAESYNICLDIGGTKVLGAIFNSKREIVYRMKKKTKSGGESSQNIEDLIISVVKDLLDGSGIKKSQIHAIAAGAPGVINQESGIVLFSPNLPWKNYNIRKPIEDQFGVPFYIGNDVNVGVLGEYKFGAAKGSQDKWTVNTELQLANPCDNFYPAEDIIYEDVTITLVVDYENVAATLTIATEKQGVENIQLNAKSIKRIENGQVLVEREGVRYNMNGAKQ